MNFTIKTVVGGADVQAQLAKDVNTLANKRVLVGVPETTASDRQQAVNQVAAKGKRKTHLAALAQKDINNAQLVYIHTFGSPLAHIPARPIIEASVEDVTNKTMIMDEFEKVAKLTLDNKPAEADTQLGRAGLLVETLARGWFTNSNNNWAPNAAITIQRKGSDRPLIDSAVMRKSIVYVKE